MKRTLFALATLAVLLTVTLWAQEPMRVNRGIDILIGDLFMGNGDIVFEGATGDAFETTFTVVDPTADRTITWPDSSGTPVLSGGSAPFLSDNLLFALGTDSDQIQLSRSTTLAADTALTDVLIGTPISEEISADSFMLSNTTSDGDVAFYGNDGGTSTQFVHFDSSAGILELAGYTGGIMLALEIDPPAPDLAGEMVHLWGGTAGSITCETNVRLCLETDDTVANFVGFLGSAGVQGLTFGDAADANIGILGYNHSTNFLDVTVGTVQHTTFDGTGIHTRRLYVREEFDTGFIIRKNDFTAKSVTDNDVMYVLGSAGGVNSFHQEITVTTSNWIQIDGALDIKGDNNADNEGIEIVVGGDGDDTTGGLIVAGTNGACFSVSVTIGDISGTDQFMIGWRQNEAFVDDGLHVTYTRWNTVGINNVDGSIFSEQEVNEATDTDDSGVNFADTEQRVLTSCISAAGVPTAFYSNASSELTQANAITMTNTGDTQTAGTQMWPFISSLSSGTDGAEPTINWWEVTGL